VLLALGFVGLAHVLVQDLLTGGRRSERGDVAGARMLGLLTIAGLVLLLALTALSLLLPGTSFIHSLAASLS
jgi:hypothetical protein